MCFYTDLKNVDVNDNKLLPVLLFAFIHWCFFLSFLRSRALLCYVFRRRCVRVCRYYDTCAIETKVLIEKNLVDVKNGHENCNISPLGTC